MRTESESSLPKWAQRELDRLRDSLKAKQTELDETLGTVPGSNVAIANYLGKPKRLPKNCEILFDLGDGTKVSVQHDRDDPKAVRVGIYSGALSIAVFPVVSNVVRIRGTR